MLLVLLLLLLPCDRYAPNLPCLFADTPLRKLDFTIERLVCESVTLLDYFSLRSLKVGKRLEPNVSVNKLPPPVAFV